MSSSPTASFDLLETTIAEVHAAMTAGRITAEALVERYLRRIETYDDELNAILTVNENARDRASELDARFDRDGFVGPLHGVPVILKDNQDTHDMPTTAGSVAFAEAVPERDAFVVTQLREAGAIVIAKANLQELSYGVDTISSLGGETRNPYDLDRRPGGSSGGTAAAIAANLATIGTGTDTCSSVRSPPAFTTLVGVRPTRGLVSRTGIVPLSESQDTAGPITRTVADAARMLEVMAGYDPDDPVTAVGAGAVPSDGYVPHLDDDGLDGARLGVVRELFGLQGEHQEFHDGAAAVTAVLERAIREMADAGADIVDPVDVVDVDWLKSARVITFEFARDFDRYLRDRGDAVPYESLRALCESGTIAPAVEARLLETDVLDVDPETLDRNSGYLRRLRRRHHLTEATLACMHEHELDALVYPPSTIPPVVRPTHQPFVEMNCELAAHTGLPAIVVPAGVTDDGLPIGVEFLGRAFAEPRLFAVAYSFERASGHRCPPERFGVLNDA